MFVCVCVCVFVCDCVFVFYRCKGCPLLFVRVCGRVCVSLSIEISLWYIIFKIVWHDYIPWSGSAGFILVAKL